MTEASRKMQALLVGALRTEAPQRIVERPDIAQREGLARAWMELQDDGKTYKLYAQPHGCVEYVDMSLSFSLPEVH